MKFHVVGFGFTVFVTKELRKVVEPKFASRTSGVYHFTFL